MPPSHPNGKKLTPTWFLLLLLASLMGVSAFYNVNSLVFCQYTLYQEWKHQISDDTNIDPADFDNFCIEVREHAEKNLNQWLTFILALMMPAPKM
jgi:tellurite resistance protein TehA-like permease